MLTIHLNKKFVGFLAVALISLVAVGPRPASALSCIQDAFEVDYSIENAEVIFVGKVVSLNPQTIPGGYASAINAGGDVWSDAVFDVSTYWKGDVSKTMNVKVALYGWYSTTPAFEVGKEYLIYANEHPEISGLVVYVDCHRTPLLSEASEDLASLGTGKVPNGTTPTQTVPNYTLGTTDPNPTQPGTPTSGGNTTTGGPTTTFGVTYDNPAQTQQPTSPSSGSVFYRNLTIGSTGEDVVQLQTILETKGFLVIPVGVSKGYFGPLTRAALAQYQASVGISPTAGYFGPITRAYIASH